jgi:hypothetical protein
MFATWKLNFTDPHYGTGPEGQIAVNGGRAWAVWTDGPVEAGGTILGKVDGDVGVLDGTDDWECVDVSLAEATQFITDNFTPTDDTTLADALTVLN